MPPDIPHRRADDSRLDMLIDQAREDRQEARDWRNQAMMKLESITVVVITQASHGKRLDELESVSPLIRQHDRWIEDDGKPSLKKITELATVVSNTQAGVSGGYKGLKLGLL